MQPFGHVFHTLAISQPLENIFPVVASGESREDLVVAALRLPELFYFVSKVLLGLSDWDFIDTLHVLLSFTSTAWSLPVALGGDINSQLRGQDL